MTPSRQAQVDKVGPAGAVVIGGGVIGCSVAYHLAKAGVSDGIRAIPAMA